MVEGPEAAHSKVGAIIDYLTVGHVTHDVCSDNSYTIGGTVSYAALTAAALHRSVGILTSAGKNFDFSLFEGAAAVVSHLASETTTFKNEYVNGHRRQTVYGVADTITPALVPQDWLRPAVVHLGPVMGECSPALIELFAGKTFLGITPQGWMRSRNGSGLIHHHAWHAAEAFAAAASAVVFSIDDARGDWDRVYHLATYARLLVVTMGRLGGIFFVKGQPTRFSALKVDEVDPTGAGDIFAAVFFSTVAAGKPPEVAANFAACLASRSVSRVGLRGVPGPADLDACSAALV